MILMLKYRLLFVVILMSFISHLKAQNVNFGAKVSGELNYTGYNTQLDFLTVIKSHQIGIEMHYNLSDGYLTNPVIGHGINYGYVILNNDRWQASIGLDYKRQKPLEHLIIHVVNYGLGAGYKITEHLSITNTIGYGTAVELVRLNGQTKKSNNISGSLQLGCAYFF
jgi:long-subunit fatty acid transport protein